MKKKSNKPSSAKKTSDKSSKPSVARQFMMLMIPAVYQGGKKVDPRLAPDPKKMEEMGKFTEELGKAVKIISVDGLQPLATGARVAFGKGKPTVTDGPFIEANQAVPEQNIAA